MPYLGEAYVSSSEAASILGLHPFGIQRLIYRGMIPAEKVANRWLIPRAFVEEFAKTYRPKRGRLRIRPASSEGGRP